MKLKIPHALLPSILLVHGIAMAEAPQAPASVAVPQVSCHEIRSLQERIKHLEGRIQVADRAIENAESSLLSLEHELRLMNVSYATALIPAGASLFASAFLGQISLPLMFAHRAGLAKLSLATALLSTPINAAQQLGNLAAYLNTSDLASLDLLKELQDKLDFAIPSMEAYDRYVHGASCTSDSPCSPDHPLLVVAESLILRTHDQILKSIDESDHWYSLELTSHLQGRRLAEAEIPLARGTIRLWREKKKFYRVTQELLRQRLHQAQQSCEDQAR